MKKTLLITLVSLALATSTFANDRANQCEEAKGNWQWNGTVNEWQCLDASNGVIAIGPTVAEVEANRNNVETTTEVGVESSWDKRSLGEKALIVAGTPVVAAGFLVAAAVVAPVYIVRKIFE